MGAETIGRSLIGSTFMLMCLIMLMFCFRIIALSYGSVLMFMLVINPLVPTTTQRDILAVFCVFTSGEDEYRRKYCDVVQGRCIAGKPMTSSPQILLSADVTRLGRGIYLCVHVVLRRVLSVNRTVRQTSDVQHDISQ